ncbi:hypothetical protein BDW62DRAFT_200156 [Aspergillus aurantiobrunneus]
MAVGQSITGAARLYKDLDVSPLVILTNFNQSSATSPAPVAQPTTMKLSALVAVAIATLAASQTVNDVPKCAVPCLQDAVTSQTSCGAQDFKCACKEENISKIQDAATGCVTKACGSDVALQQVLPAVKKLCANQ